MTSARAAILSLLFVLSLSWLDTGTVSADETNETNRQTAFREVPVTAADRQHWAFRPLVRPSVPQVVNVTWPRSSIDRFILARIEAAGLSPQPAADRVTLIRRLAFDLTGLPPTPREIAEFVNDQSPDAYDRLVDRLLASSDYGVRWGQHWLDLARFAETDGFEHDLVRQNAWRYRDWVIDALNQDLPLDEFIRMQLAGDELHPDDPSASIATGFLLCGPDMPDINLQEERRHTFLNDMTATVSSVFLGLQLGCAQCHDHKYDPVSQFDFYRFRAFFEHDDLFKQHPVPTPQQRAARERFDVERAEKWNRLEASIKQLESDVLTRIRRERKQPNLKIPMKQLIGLLVPAESKHHRRLAAELAQVKRQSPPALPMGRVMRERNANVKPSYLRIRGDFRRLGPRVFPAYPRIAAVGSRKVPASKPDAVSSGRRTALANWLTQPDHPLTTRVLANRIWQFHFGHGLCRTPSDFGLAGESPTHPKLLDWLATELPRVGWSLKQMHRLIVTSATYRQASRLVRPSGHNWTAQQAEAARRNWQRTKFDDPGNELLARMPRRRLEGEAIRDAMLAASGGLSQRRGGQGIWPPLPKELLVTLLKNQWPVSPDPRDHRRRSLYLFVRRNFRFPILDVFDKPDSNASCPRRNQSTIAPQALMLLNSELSLSTAREFAAYIFQHADRDPRSRIKLCYLRALGRQPTDDEQELAMRFVQADARQLRESGVSSDRIVAAPIAVEGVDCYDFAALTDLCLAVFNLNEFIYID